MENISYKILPPSESLKPFVKHYLYVNIDLVGRFKAISSPYIELFFLFKPVKVVNKNSSLFKPKIFFSGYQELDHDNFTHMYETHIKKGFVIVFQTFGFYRLFGLKPCEFANYLIDGDDLVRSELDELWGQLNELEQPILMKNKADAMLARFLNRKINGHPLVDRIFGIIKKNNGLLRMDQLCGYIDISPRKLQRIMKNEVGITTKDLMQIVRFNHVLNNIQALEYSKLTEISYLCGYFDQSHFIRDFKRITGKTPRVLRSENDNESVIRVVNRSFVLQQ